MSALEQHLTYLTWRCREMPTEELPQQRLRRQGLQVLVQGTEPQAAGCLLRHQPGSWRRQHHRTDAYPRPHGQPPELRVLGGPRGVPEEPALDAGELQEVVRSAVVILLKLSASSFKNSSCVAMKNK